MLLFFAGLVGIAEGLLLWMSQVGQAMETFAPVVMCVTFLPAISWGIFALDVSPLSKLDSEESGYSHWLLRMPIANWKLAYIPIGMKTAWVFTLWIVLSKTLEWFGASTWVLIPAFVVAATGVLMSALAWRPFRSGVYRLGMLGTLTLVSYGLCLLAIGGKSEANLSTSVQAIVTVATVVYFLVALIIAYRAVVIARHHVSGMIPAESSGVMAAIRNRLSWDCSGEQVALHRSSIRALVWHDLRRSRAYRFNLVLFVVCPVLVGASLFHWSPVALAVMSVMSMFYVGIISATSVLGHDPKQSISTLPSYLSVSPLSDATIAWTRFAMFASCLGLLLLLSLVLYAAVMVWPENRETWSRWATWLAAHDTVTGTATLVGFRVTLAIMLFIGLLLLGISSGYVWVPMYGHRWVDIVVILVSLALFFGVLFTAVAWIIAQPDWQTMTASMKSFLNRLQSISYLAVLAKFAAVIVTVIVVSRSRVARTASLLQVIAIWTVVTLAIGTLLFGLIPDSRFTLPICLTFVALILPLPSILALPLALKGNRHR
ncbi:putative membrane protein [Rhodopirellula maiorica SM1]|uniref:Putative membrane protein n=1 Tax=Rhodopirellula maiorica SM1 TaxID=1265738 RepID=M5R9B1_9BACT|nr:putative membrane protein [Rhodopirellula maiorica SM1]